MDYKCDMCGKPATVHITKIIDGKKTKLHLCQNCAQSGSATGGGFPAQILPNIKKLEEQILDIARPKRASEPVCPKCGTKLSAFEKRGRFTCPECYEAFKPKVLDMLAHMHGSVEHKGKRPGKSAAPKKAALPAKNSPQLEMEFSQKPEAHQPEADFENAVFEAAPPCKGELLTELKAKLVAAIKDERYEDAAVIRDKINELEKACE